MKFEGVRCDECESVKGDSNHWIELQVLLDANRYPQAVIAGEAVNEVRGTGSFSGLSSEQHDLCGQACALKHIARLLGWSA